MTIKFFLSAEFYLLNLISLSNEFASFLSHSLLLTSSGKYNQTFTVAGTSKNRCGGVDFGAMVNNFVVGEEEVIMHIMKKKNPNYEIMKIVLSK